jgi:hypothetical protein
MFLTHTVMGNMLLERTMFTNLTDAKKWAQDRVQEKVQRIDHMAFMGDVNVVFYEISPNVSSNHVDKPFLIV